MDNYLGKETVMSVGNGRAVEKPQDIEGSVRSWCVKKICKADIRLSDCLGREKQTWLLVQRNTPF